MSDHGHGPLRNFLYVNNFLKQRGYLKIKSAPASQLKNIAFQAGLTPRTAYGTLLNLGLGKLRRTLDKRRGGRGLLKRFFLSLNDVDWSSTLAYSIGYIGEVHLNVKGREPQGIVQPGAEYERVRDNLIRDLKTLALPDGSPLIGQIWKKEEIYNGEHLDDAPDILFFPKHLETIAFGDFEFGSNKVIEPSYGVSSSHRMNGILIASGQNIRPNYQITGSPNLTDLAPTILNLLHLPVPLDMDGRVLTEMFTGSHAVTYGGSAELKRDRQDTYSDEQEQEVMERLKDLGYIS
jgi:predicted AlkP superfamily phosphohydrolase/phosphomutase